VRALERLQHIAYYALGEVSCDAADGGGIFLDKSAKVLSGLILFAEDDGVVLVENVAVAGGEDDSGRDGDEVAGGLAAAGVVGEGSDGLREDGAVEGGVGVGVVVVEDDVFGAGVELADGGLGEGHLGVEGLGFGGEDGYGEGADIRGNVGRGAGLVVAATGEADDEREDKKAHAAVFYCRIGGILSGKILLWWNMGFTGGFAEKWVLDVVFLWSCCGFMCGKDGRWNDVFPTLKIMQEFRNYFAGCLNGALSVGLYPQQHVSSALRTNPLEFIDDFKCAKNGLEVGRGKRASNKGYAARTSETRTEVALCITM
jgi:hypothetical protein